MKEVATDTRTLSPWADVAGILTNAKSLTVLVDGEKHEGKATLSLDDSGHVTLDFGGRKKRSVGRK